MAIQMKNGKKKFIIIRLKCYKNEQNDFFLHFFAKKFAYVKKKLYLCTRIQNKSINKLNLMIMKKVEIKTLKGIVLLPVGNSKFGIIQSAIEKANYIRNHESGTYTFHNGGHLVEEFQYMVIDVENNGYCLTPKHGITYNEAKNLIEMYL